MTLKVLHFAFEIVFSEPDLPLMQETLLGKFSKAIKIVSQKFYNNLHFHRKRQFNGIIDCYVKTIKADGVRGLYRGFVVSCVCIFIYRGLYFGLFDSLKPVLLGDNSAWIATFMLGWGVTITSGIVSIIFLCHTVFYSCPSI
jgi:hypothetical protein